MKRKIVKQGQATMTVSLPSKWIKKNNLSSGDEIDVAEQDNSLIVSTGRKEITKTFSFDAASKKSMTGRTILYAYTSGYDEVHIKYKDPLTLKKIKNATQELIGFEIVQESNSACTLKELTSINQLDFSSTFRRIFRIISGMCEESAEAIKTRNDAALENLIMRDFDVNKFSNLCARYLNKIGHPMPERTGTYLIICHTLEIIGDGYKRLFEHARIKKIAPEYIELIKKINTFFSKCYELTFELKDEKAVEAAELYESIKKELNEEKYKDMALTAVLANISDAIITLDGLQITFTQ